MIDKLLSMSMEEIKKGYSYDGQADRYICNICGRAFESGEIFEVGGRYFDANKTVRNHIREAHPDMLDILASNGKKYTGITENQRELFKLMHSGMADSEIAKKTGVAPSTIRHQRFVFREKARQAKLYLAIYELAMLGAEKRRTPPDEKEETIHIHEGAKMVDERYDITKAEEEKILSNMFSSLSPLRLKTFFTREKNKIVILKKISEQFDRDRKYSEKEVNETIKPIFEDFAVIRRYLIEYGFMERTKDCREYWLK